MSAERNYQPPMMQPHRGEAGAYPPPPAPTAPEVGLSLTYVNCMNQFNALDNQEQFSVYATRLWIKLVDRCSRLYWKNPFKQADPYLAAICGNWSVNTLKKHRQELERRGLLRFAPGGNGAGNMGIYMLLIGNEYEPELDLESYFKVSNADTLSDTVLGESTVKVSRKVSDKVSDKVSPNDTNKRLKTKDKDLFLRGGSAHPLKKIEQVVEHPENPGDASHTGGGAAAGGRVVPLPYEDGQGPPPFVDPRLTSQDPNAWQGRPESVEMVADFYRQHLDPAQQAKAPRAHLFFNHYKGQGWRKGNGMIITDWRSVAEGYKCQESYGSSTNPAGSGGASQPADRYKNTGRGGFGKFGAKKLPAGE
jgi:hypothetical protein